jgi:DNA-binding Lrp family transcriptional regulator
LARIVGGLVEVWHWLIVDLISRAVKSRIDKMISNGVIESFILNVNPAKMILESFDGIQKHVFYKAT